MARINLSIPDELKSKMDLQGGTANWSNVAQTAFEKELLMIEANQQVENMDDVVSRLRASKMVSIEDVLPDAKEKGRNWAKQGAEYVQLKALGEAHWEGMEGGYWRTAGAVAISNHENESLDDVDTHQSNDFWEEWIDMTWRNDSDVADAAAGAFVEGAVEIWEEIKDQV